MFKTSPSTILKPLDLYPVVFKSANWGGGGSGGGEGIADIVEAGVGGLGVKKPTATNKQNKVISPTQNAFLVLTEPSPISFSLIRIGEQQLKQVWLPSGLNFL